MYPSIFEMQELKKYFVECFTILHTGAVSIREYLCGGEYGTYGQIRSTKGKHAQPLVNLSCQLGQLMD